METARASSSLEEEAIIPIEAESDGEEQGMMGSESEDTDLADYSIEASKIRGELQF